MSSSENLFIDFELPPIGPHEHHWHLHVFGPANGPMAGMLEVAVVCCHCGLKGVARSTECGCGRKAGFGPAVEYQKTVTVEGCD